jgi:hypothetical protein
MKILCPVGAMPGVTTGLFANVVLALTDILLDLFEPAPFFGELGFKAF